MVGVSLGREVLRFGNQGFRFVATPEPQTLNPNLGSTYRQSPLMTKRDLGSSNTYA